MSRSANSISSSRTASNIATSFRRVCVLAAVALPVGILAQPVEARSVAAAVGVVAPWDAGCLSYAYGTVTNVCNYTISFDWPLPVDSGGNKRVGVDVLRPTSTSSIGCLAEGLNEETTWVWWSNGGAYSSTTSFGASANILMDGAYVPGGGQLLVNCQIGPGVRVQVANWPG